MKHLNYLYSTGFYLLSCYVIKTQTICPQPDVPAEGQYTPQQSKFELGDEVIYSCKKGFALSGTNRRICKSTWAWSDHAPFCDHASRLSNPSVTNKGVLPQEVYRVVDDNSSSCFDWHNTTGEFLYLHVDKTVIVRSVKIFLKKGITDIQILTGFDNNMKLCAVFHNFIETDRWITVSCKSDVLADTVKILVKDKRLISVCEIEVYGKEEDSCDHPPMRTIPNGHLEISRSKATLVCEEGYKSVNNNRLACEGKNSWAGATLKCDEILCDPMLLKAMPGGEWIFLGAIQKLSAGTRSELVCVKGYQKVGVLDFAICLRDGTWSKTNATCEEKGIFKSNSRDIIIGSVVIIIGILIISLLATTIHFIRKQRNKEEVVVFQPQSDGSVPLSVSEMEYSAAPRYEPLPVKIPELPTTPRPNAVTTTSFGGGKANFEHRENTLKKQSLSPDITFNTMKASTIYGS